MKTPQFTASAFVRCENEKQRENLCDQLKKSWLSRFKSYKKKKKKKKKNRRTLDENKMKSQVLSIEQMQTLKGKGFDISIGSMMWVCHYDTLTLKDHAELMLRDEIIEQSKECMPTMTLQDILDVLPQDIITETCSSTLWVFNGGVYYCDSRNLNSARILFDGNFLSSAYEALLWCIDNGYVGVKHQQILSDSQQKFIMNKFTKVE